MDYPKITATIPCYNQPGLLSRLLTNLTQQDYPNWEIVIVDDASSDNAALQYRSLASLFPSLNITYRRNQENLGAIANMISCLMSPSAGEYLICLHEDDLLAPGYLKQAAEILSREANIAWVASPAIVFQPGETVAPQKTDSANYRHDAISLAEAILSGNPFVFGSVVYRTSAIAPKNIELEKYGVFFDRPFLINTLIGANSLSAVMKWPHYYYQDHPYPDGRYRSLSWENVFSLYSFYRQITRGTTPQIAGRFWFDFANLENKHNVSLVDFFKKGRELKLIDRGCDWRFLIAGIFIFIFGKKIYDRIFRILKRRRKANL